MPRPTTRVDLGFLACFAMGLCWLLAGWLRDSCALVSAFDTGLYLQLLRNFARDLSLASSLTGEHNFLAHHFQPAVLALAPLPALLDRPIVLLAASLASVLVTARMLLKLAGRLSLGAALATALALAFVAQPAIAARVWRTFEPEVLALPFLLYQAIALADDEEPDRTRFWKIAACQLAAGLCKENLWLVNAFCSLLLLGKRGFATWKVLALAAANASIFALVFLVWMPANTALAGYHALGYYSDSAAPSKLELLSAMARNAASSDSLLSVAIAAVVLTVGAPYLKLNRALLGALPGLAFVLAAKSDQVRHYANHYPLLFLPFLFASAAFALSHRAAWLKHKAVRIALPVALVAVPLGVTLFQQTAGVVWLSREIGAQPERCLLRDDVEKVRGKLALESELLTDHDLQPLLAAQPNVKTIVAGAGIPIILTDEDLARVTDVVTTIDARRVDCDSVHAPSAQARDAYVRYCRWLQSSGMGADVYPDSHLVHFHR